MKRKWVKKTVKKKALNRKKLSSTYAAYYAAAIDCDGYVGRREGESSGYMGITNTNLKFLKTIQSFIGGRVVTNGNHLREGKSKICYSLHIRKEEQKVLLPQIIPYMRIKKEKAVSLLRLYREQDKR